MAKGTLKTRLISDIYGVKNLYKDARNSENVNNLEEKLAAIETKAAAVIKTVHESLSTGSLCLKRESLEHLKKFLFLMHYRIHSMTSINRGAYTHATHTDTAGDQYDVSGAWLDELSYYLNTSHHKIMEDGWRMIEEYGFETVQSIKWENRCHSDADPWAAVPYYMMAGSYFLCIWEAFPGEEFVLGHNSFGLWEGMEGINTGLHRIFIISPRIALVLRSTSRRNGRVREDDIFSYFYNVPHGPPIPTYADGAHVLSGKAAENLDWYRATTTAEEDTFLFEIKRLNQAKTQAINDLVLRNIQDNGSLVFSSRPCMSRTVINFASLSSSIDDRSKYLMLARHLTGDSHLEFTSDTVVLPTRRTYHWTSEESLEDLQLRNLISKIYSTTITFQSDYDRAYQIHHHCTAAWIDQQY